MSASPGLLGAVAPLGLAPAPILQGGSGSVRTTASAGVELGQVDGDFVLRPAAVELGRALARLHCLPVGGADLPDAPRPWPLQHGPLTAVTPGGEPPGTRAITDRLNDRMIGGALDLARTQWRPTHLVHGNIAARNVIVQTSPAGDVSTSLSSFEHSGLGCPEHDLAAAAAMLEDLSRPGLDLVAVCLGAYWAACGPASFTAPWRCVSALLSAWRVALTHGDEGAADVARLLSLAATAADEVALPP